MESTAARSRPLTLPALAMVALVSCLTNPETGERELDAELAAITLEATAGELETLAPLFPAHETTVLDAAEAVAAVAQVLAERGGTVAAGDAMAVALELLEPLAELYVERQEGDEQAQLWAMRVRAVAGTARNLLRYVEALEARSDGG